MSGAAEVLALVADLLRREDGPLEVGEISGWEIRVRLGDPDVLAGTPLTWRNSSTFVLKAFQTS